MLLERKLSDLLPPNVNAEQVKGWIIALLTITTLMCGILFLCSYTADYGCLFRYWGSKRQTIMPGAIIPQFDRYAIRTVYVIGGALLLTLASTALLYSSYYQGSRSIYLMHRLPDGRRILRRQIWSVPLRVMVLLLLLGVVMLAVSWLVWRFVTPEQCLPTPENIQRAMNDIAASPYSKQLP
ncbi:MAG: hypothetical protein ACI3VI_01015 [Vescimonas sp.]